MFLKKTKRSSKYIVNYVLNESKSEHYFFGEFGNTWGISDYDKLLLCVIANIAKKMITAFNL